MQLFQLCLQSLKMPEMEFTFSKVQLFVKFNSFTGFCQGFSPQVFHAEQLFAEHLAVTAFEVTNPDLKGT